MSGLPSKQTSKRTSFLSVQCHEKATSTMRSPHWRGLRQRLPINFVDLRLMERTRTVQPCSLGVIFRLEVPGCAYQAPAKHPPTAATCSLRPEMVASIAFRGGMPMPNIKDVSIINWNKTEAKPVASGLERTICSQALCGSKYLNVYQRTVLRRSATRRPGWRRPPPRLRHRGTEGRHHHLQRQIERCRGGRRRASRARQIGTS